MNSLKERPILFSAPMVRAIIEGRKTQTRRAIKRYPEGRVEKFYELPIVVSAKRGLLARWVVKQGYCPWPDWDEKCQYGEPGDRLWVRETWRTEELESGLDGVRYAADNYFCPIENTFDAAEAWGDAHFNKHGEAYNPLAWRPSIFMPRWASRITLEIVNIRVERVQDISEHDAQAEGAHHLTVGNNLGPYMPWDVRPPQGYRAGFRNLWNSINDPRGYGWNVNPWVWVIEFKKL